MNWWSYKRAYNFTKSNNRAISYSRASGVISGPAGGVYCGSIKSFLFDSENLQDLFDRHAETGIMEIDKNGKLTNRELCAEDHNIGIDKSSGLPTNTFKTHQSKQDAYISV